jgi:hypothetical protein
MIPAMSLAATTNNVSLDAIAQWGLNNFLIQFKPNVPV